MAKQGDEDRLVEGMKNLNINNQKSKQYYISLFEDSEFVEAVEELDDLTDVQFKAIMEDSKLVFSESQKKKIQKSTNRNAYSSLEFLKSLEKFPSLYSLLKVIERNKRDDISEVLRKYLPAGTAGPRLNRDVYIKDMPIRTRHDLIVELSFTRPDCRDWRMIAEKLKIDNTYIKLWDQKKETPMENVLNVWEKQTDSTVGRLYDILVEKNMGQIADIL